MSSETEAMRLEETADALEDQLVEVDVKVGRRFLVAPAAPAP